MKPLLGGKLESLMPNGKSTSSMNLAKGQATKRQVKQQRSSNKIVLEGTPKKTSIQACRIRTIFRSEQETQILKLRFTCEMNSARPSESASSSHRKAIQPFRKSIFQQLERKILAARDHASRPCACWSGLAAPPARAATGKGWRGASASCRFRMPCWVQRETTDKFCRESSRIAAVTDQASDSIQKEARPSCPYLVTKKARATMAATDLRQEHYFRWLRPRPPRRRCYRPRLAPTTRSTTTVVLLAVQGRPVARHNINWKLQKRSVAAKRAVAWEANGL